MQICPQCGRRYDDRFRRCSVDDAELQPVTGLTKIDLLPGASNGRRSYLIIALVGFIPLCGGIAVVATTQFQAQQRTPHTERQETLPPVKLPLEDVDGGLEPQPRMVRIETIPPGARIIEQGNVICATTPCDVEQPSFAPATRTLTVELDGHEPATAVLNKEAAGLQVELAPLLPAPAPVPEPQVPEPEPPLPASDDPLFNQR